MHTLIYKRHKGQKPQIIAEKDTIKEAMQHLKQIYTFAHEHFFDEITDNDKLSPDLRELDLFGTHYWIERDTRL